MTESNSKSAKRKADEEPATSNQRLKFDHGTEKQKKSCISCGETDTTFPKVSENCKGSHTNDVCHLCWVKYITTQVMDEAHEHVRCVQYDICNSCISYEDLKRIASPKNLKHYDELIRRRKAKENGEIECLADVTDAGNNRVTCHHFQNHDEARDGRVFVCENCGNQRCVRCGVREHKGETCVEFRARLDRDHGKEEEKTAQSFRDGYEGKEVVGEGKKERWKWKHPKPCTSCGQMIEKDGRCDHMTCVRCANEFCMNCHAPYYGKGSVPELGNKAHKEDCPYFSRAEEDRRYKRPEKHSTAEKGSDEAVDAST